jgi:transporter family-2 protein
VLEVIDLKKLMIYFKGNRVRAVLAPLFKMLEALFELFVPLTVTYIIDVGLKENNRSALFGMFGIMIALLSGALMSIQGVFNTGVTKQTSLWVATGFVQLTALLVCIVAWLFTGRESISAIGNVSPKYLLLGGVIGAFITMTVVKSMGDLGPASATLLIVVAQLAVSYLIELFGLFGADKADFSWRKLFGMVIAVIGIIIFRK